jgi:hypothetical protein
VIKKPRPQNRLRANARATGIAKTVLKNADRIACQIVNFTAAQSDGLRAKSPSARDTTASNADKISAAIKTAALIPSFGLILPTFI